MSMRSFVSQYTEQLRLKLDQLAVRDRIALCILLIFLLVFSVVSSVWYLHKAADQAQGDAIEQRELLLWMRSQVPNIQTNPAAAQPLSEILQGTARQQGLTITQNGMGDQLQVGVTHQSFAVLGTWLTRVVEQGVVIKQLEIKQQNDGELQLNAVMQQSS